MPDMRLKVEEYASEIQQEIDRCTEVMEDRLWLAGLKSDAAKEGYLDSASYAKMEARIQTLAEVRGDLLGRLEERI